MEKKVVLITGASSGIGAGIAVHFAELGYRHLSLVARRLPELERVAEKSRAAGATDVISLSKDLTDLDACEAAVKETVDHFGRLDILICNAGGADGKRRLVRELPTRVFNMTMALNVNAPFVMTKTAIPHLEKTRGTILYVSSVAGLMPFKGGNAYCTAKCALNMLAKCVALEAASTGVTANVLSPGMVATPIHTSKSEDEETMNYMRENCRPMQPLGRVGEVWEMVKLAAFMVSEDNTFMTGANVVSDGGITLRLEGPRDKLWAGDVRPHDYVKDGNNKKSKL